MRKRTRAREVALQILYQYDIRKEDPGMLIDDYWKREYLSENKLDDSVRDFAAILVKGTIDNLEKIDSMVISYTENWKLERMAVVDRNIMRMATYELLFMHDIPPKVSINEAVDLAKKYGDVDSGKFVNGILDKIGKSERKEIEGKES
ncbi:MAG: transcription antitermination factor NusB [Candidatus Omnitrophota bacterium]